MSKKANPTMIGSFVVGGVLLLAVAAAIFGGSELLAKKSRLITYFDSSVQGLRVGSSVMFRGVRIGYVTDIDVIVDADTLEFLIPVEFELVDGAADIYRKGEKLEDQNIDLGLTELIDAGLRAQLNSESFVTGQLLIELDLHPNTPVVLRGLNREYEEIPSIPSTAQMFVEKIQNLVEKMDDFEPEEMVSYIESILAGIDELANSEDLRETLAGANRLVNNADTQDLPEDLDVTLAELRGTLVDARRLVNNADEDLSVLLESAGPIVQELEITLESVSDLLSNASQQLDEDSQSAYQLRSTLKEVEGASRSLRLFLDYIEQNPEALIRGKKNP